MATPSVFLSSTFYDLKYVRENIRYFIEKLGYVPVLSEDGAVFYDPKKDAQDACLTEIPNCQLFVLVVGGRFGSEFKDSGGSITNAEYREAVGLKIPIFALVEQGVYSDFQVYKKNRGSGVALEKLVFPNCDDVRIFEFIEEVQTQAVNNALVPFRDFGDMESYLRQQWAGMMHSFLVGASENERVADTLAALADMNRHIEILSSQILKSVGSTEAQAVAEMYARMLGSRVIHDLIFIGVRPSPADVLEYASFDECVLGLGASLKVNHEDNAYSLSASGEISKSKYSEDLAQYEAMRVELQSVAARYGVNGDEVRRQQAGAPLLT